MHVDRVHLFMRNPSQRNITCHMKSQSVICHPTQVNVKRQTQPVKPVLDLPIPKG